jgi:hypothetical protein
MKLAVPDLISNSYFPAVAAVELGFFKQHNLDLSLEIIAPTERAYAALRDGEVDFVGSSAHSTLTAFPEWNGAKILPKFFAPFNEAAPRTPGGFGDIVACGKSFGSGAPDDDDADARVGISYAQGRANVGAQLLAESIHPFRTIEGNRRDPVVRIVDQGLVGHILLFI